MIKQRAVLAVFLAVAMVAACGGGAGHQGESAVSAGAPTAAPTPSADSESDDKEARVVGQDWQRFAFDGDPVGSVPGGFTSVHSGDGEEGKWQVVEAPDVPSGPRAVAQIDADRTNHRFPLLVLDSLVARDVELEVTGRPISGTKDQAIGLIWRYRDADNYYVVRANALEDNVVLYKMEAGKRSDLDLKGRGRTYGLDAEVPSGTWSRLGVRVQGNLFTALLDGRELFQVEDDTFTDVGKVGLWTKADSVTWFDDFGVRVLDGPGLPESEQEESDE